MTLENKEGGNVRGRRGGGAEGQEVTALTRPLDVPMGAGRECLRKQRGRRDLGAEFLPPRVPASTGPTAWAPRASTCAKALGQEAAKGELTCAG